MRVLGINKAPFAKKENRLPCPPGFLQRSSYKKALQVLVSVGEAEISVHIFHAMK